MQTLRPNLFEALFNFHPREDHTPKENFLTEAFAYLLRTDEGVRDRWLSVLLRKNVEGVTCEVQTRQTERDVDADTSIFPDLWISGQFSDGQKFAVYCEHKWDSHCDERQLRKYRKLAESKKACLVFVGTTDKQRSEAARCLPGKPSACFLWENVFYELNGLPEKSTILQEFLEFMKSQGLSPGQPLTIEKMAAFLQAADFVKSLLNLAHKLQANYPWDAIPQRFHANNYVHDAWGRVGIRFETKDWKPAITVGFLYDESDHRVTLVNRDKGIDLLLRIEAMPKHTKNLGPALDVLKAKQKELKRTAASVLLKGERGNGNAYSLLIVRDCLGDVIGQAKSQAVQLTAIYKKLTTWLEILFKDWRIEDAFKKMGLDSGMK